MRILVTNDDGINAPGLVALEAIAAVTPHDAPGVFCLQAGNQCREYHEHPGEPGRDEVQQIVKPRRSPAELFIARGAVADHAVGGVGDFI